MSEDGLDETRRISHGEDSKVWEGTRTFLRSGAVTAAQKIEALTATLLGVATAIISNYVTKLFIQYQS
jgi:hypothetical protein